MAVETLTLGLGAFLFGVRVSWISIGVFLIWYYRRYKNDDPTLNMTIEEMRQEIDEFDKATELAEEGM